LGSARNTGVQASHGRYLAFVDSDDVLPTNAYAAMIATLETTGSDFAIGTLKRDNGRRCFATQRMRNNHRARRLRVTLDQMPGILADVFAVNKVFRRSFWSSAGLTFPVGVRYEDQPTLTAAYLRAGSFDVLRDTVYVWRAREDGSSITQQRHELADLRDRVTTKRAADALLLDAPPHVRHTWLTDVLPVDMGKYFRSVPGCAPQYWNTLRDAVRELWPADAVPFEQTVLPVQERVMGCLVAADRRADLERLLRFTQAHAHGVPFQLRDGTVACGIPGHDDAGIAVPGDWWSPTDVRHEEAPPRRPSDLQPDSERVSVEAST
jgi:hypothetical protein